jgi:hypothetical protein
MTSETQLAVARHDSGVDADPDLSRMVPVWNGILHEDGTSVIADLDDVVERALRLAAPTLGRTSVSLHKERRTGVTNRGSALESLLAALLVDLVRADRRAAAGQDQQDQQNQQDSVDRPLRIDIHVEATRGALLLSIESDGRRPSLESWRFVLSADLAARIGATVSTLPDTAGYLVRFS